MSEDNEDEGQSSVRLEVMQIGIQGGTQTTKHPQKLKLRDTKENEQSHKLEVKTTNNEPTPKYS